MAGKTHLCRVRAARRRIAADMRRAGLDPDSHADHMTRLDGRRERLGLAAATAPAGKAPAA